VNALHKFLTDPEVPKRRDDPIRERSWKSYYQIIMAFLGWLHHYGETPREQLDIKLMTNLEQLEDYIAWGISDRGNGYAWALNIVIAALNVAKWQYHRQSKQPMYRDVPEVEAIRIKSNEIGRKRKKEASRLHLDEKMISLDQCEEVVRYLRRCTAPKTRCRSQRSENAIMQSWRRYLIIALLTYVPVRQREIRELELGRTLFREADGYWVKLAPEDHKTGSKTGKGREYPLPTVLTADLDYWLNELRPKVPTNHNYVFIHLNASRPESYGNPLSDVTVGSLVKTTMYTATGNLFDNPKRTTPHDFRRIAITWQRKYGNPAQQEALAELMGHSVQEANKTYSQLTSRDVTERAKEWWKPITNLAPMTPVKLPTAPTQPKSNQTANYKIVANTPKAIDLHESLQDDPTNKKLKSTSKTDNSKQLRDNVSIAVQLNAHSEQQEITKRAQPRKASKVKAIPPAEQLNLFDVDNQVSS
jgi:integrase